MRITRGVPTGLAEQTVVGNYTLQAVGSGAERKFRQTFLLNLPTGGAADGLRFLSDSLLRLSFAQYEFDALADDALEEATVSNKDNGVLLSLAAARSIYRVKVNGAQATDTLQMFRTDGEVIADDPVKQAAHGSAGATFNVVDQRVLLRRVPVSGATLLRSNQMGQVLLRSDAANPRVGLIVPLLGPDVFLLTPASGPLFANPTSNTNVSAPLLTLLTTLADRLEDALTGSLLPAVLSLQLRVESDTPARLNITHFDVGYRLLRRRFSADSDAPKQVLRFAGAAVDRQTLTIDVPKAVAITKAELQLAASFSLNQPDASTAGTGGSASNGTPLLSQVASDDGVQVDAGTELATPLVLPNALLPEGGAIMLVALQPTTQANVSLYTDARGAPGELLARTSLSASLAGQRHSYRFRFKNAPVVAAGNAWLSLQVSDGAATWVLREDAQQQTAAQTVAGVQRRASGNAWERLSAAQGRMAIAELFAVAPEDNTTSQPSRGLQIKVAGVALAAAAAGDDRVFTFTQQANGVAQQVTSDLAPFTLEVQAAEKGQVTVFAPHLEYDV